MNIKQTILWITRTAVFIALLVAAQIVTAPFGNSIITGSIVNLILIISVMISGVSSGVCIAVISPVMAKLVGIGPLWSLIPFIIIGNAVLVTIWHFVGNKVFKGEMASYISALIIAAVAKFIVLYISIVKIAIPFFLGLPEKQAATISAMFSVPQLITASIGGVIAVMVLPVLKKAVNREQ